MNKNTARQEKPSNGQPPSSKKIIAIKPVGMGDGKPSIIKVGKPVHSLAQRQRQNHPTVPLSPLHDFVAKLTQPSVLERLREYVQWQSQWRAAYQQGVSMEAMLESAPRQAPISINLDLTTNCNYRCDHCVDIDILNTPHRHEHEKLKQGLSHLIERGLKSVIIIGGGEPTIYPGFEDIVRHLKAANISIGIVTNGSLMKKIAAVAEVLQAQDWVRLSLDSADNETFRLMHKPGNKKCTLDWICEQIPPIKKMHPGFQIGYSFIIVWRHCHNHDVHIIENIDEIYAAAERAKQYHFDYISYKPFLVRAETNNAEIIEFDEIEKRNATIVAHINREIARARQLQDQDFRIVESTNLRVLANNSYRDYSEQPHTCHMQFFRQVLSPLGLFNCPVYRHVEQATIGNKNAYCSSEHCDETTRNTLRLIEKFDASKECQSVTCLYNQANWYIEDLIKHPEKLDELHGSAEKEDYFL